MEGLVRNGHVVSPDQIEILHARMEDIPPAQQHSIRYLLIQRGISQLLPDQGEQLAVLDHQIETMRAQVDFDKAQ